MTHGDDSQADRDRVDAFASEDELTIQEFLQQAALTAPGRPSSRDGKRRRAADRMCRRAAVAGQHAVLQVLPDPLLMSYHFKHLDDQDRQWLLGTC